MSSLVTTDSGGRKGREITGVYPQSLQDPKMGGYRLAKMADEEDELGTSGHEVEHHCPNLVFMFYFILFLVFLHPKSSIGRNRESGSLSAHFFYVPAASNLSGT
jgi:hypothetical protein